MVGCYLTPKLISRVGHSRAFASLASLGAISAILQMVLPNKDLRLSYFCSWSLHYYGNMDYNKNVKLQGYLEYFKSSLLEPATYVAYNIVAVMCCLSVLPLSLTTTIPDLKNYVFQ